MPSISVLDDSAKKSTTFLLKDLHGWGCTRFKKYDKKLNKHSETRMVKDLKSFNLCLPISKLIGLQDWKMENRQFKVVK